MRPVLLLSLFAMLARAAFAQGISGSFTGSVSDSTGAVIQGAQVTATSVESGRSWRTVTNDAGVYNLTTIPPGNYTLTIEASGFKRLVTNNIALEVNQTARLDLKLEV